MTQIAYTVICTIRYHTKEEEWLDWLKNGHIDDVLKAGATSAEIVKHDIDPHSTNGVTYEIRYKFDNRGIFEQYVEEHAPRLRKEGLEKFPYEDGFHYGRTIGEVID